jgi:hypothetical protein
VDNRLIAQLENFRLLNSEIAVGLIEGPARDRGVRSEAFMEDELVPNAPADLLSRDEFVKSKLVMREQGSGSRQVVETALKEAGYALKTFVSSL